MKRNNADLPPIENAPDWRGVALGYYKAGLESRRESRQEDGLGYVKAAIASLNNIVKKDFSDDDWHNLASYQNTVGNIYANKNQHDEALKYYQEALGNIKHLINELDKDQQILLAKFFLR